MKEQIKHSKNIQSYLGNKKPDYIPTSALVEKDLYQKVKAIIKKEKVSWKKLIEALLQRFVDEMKEQEDRR